MKALKNKPSLILCFITVSLMGCSTAPKTYKQPELHTQSPVGETLEIRLRQFAPGVRIQADAMSLLGARYTLGGATPKTGFDCSGLTLFVHQQNDIIIPRQSKDQFKYGDRISRHDLRSGDLVFFETYRKGASHVGIYIGDNQFIHAPNRRKNVEVESLSNHYYRQHYLGARRYW